jgi:hypothetical protein
VHWRWGCEVLGSDECQLGGVGREPLGQHVCEILQQLNPVRHLARRGRPGAGTFRVRLRAIPPKHLDPGMRLKPRRPGGGLPIEEEGEGAPACEITHERAIGVTIPSCEIVHAKDLGCGQSWGRAPADHAQQGMAANRAA